MVNDEQLIALGKLLAANSLLCGNISSALAYLFGGIPCPESVGTLIGYLRPPDQANAALQLLEERSKNGNFSAKVFHNLRESLQKAMDLAMTDFRLPGVDFDLSLYLQKMAEGSTEAGPTEVAALKELWPCLNVTLETEKIEALAVEYLQATIMLILAQCNLRMDEERSSVAEKPDAPAVDLGVS
jgi:hypothetical protein